VLFLRASAQKVFFPFLAERFPHLLRRYQQRFGANANARGPYVDALRQRIQAIRAAQGLAASPAISQPQNGEEDDGQRTLFPLQ
jgi:hypothetical protein